MTSVSSHTPYGQQTLITGTDGSFSGYLAVPASLPAPAVVVIQEIYGINADMRATCDGLASQGYVALCPDLYWRIEPGVSLTDKTPEENAKAMQLLSAFDVEAGMRDLVSTIGAARRLPIVSGRVGVVGYCLGGRLAYLCAARTDANACVAYYGVGIDGYLNESGNIRNPLLMHMGEQDEYVPPETRSVVVNALSGNPFVEIHTYPSGYHAFGRNNGMHFNAAAAALANSRTADFFLRTLKPD